jgi:hypothetical protein
MFALLFVAAVSTLVLRLRGARGIERQQIKWPAYTAVVAASGSVLTEIIYEAIGSVWLGWLGYVLSLIGLIGFPISIGITKVRYRLYEIDLLINRTLVYGSLTATLVVLYFGGIVVLQRMFVLLRDETDLEALNNDLVGVVRETMQPAHVSLWLRPDTVPKGGQTD